MLRTATFLFAVHLLYCGNCKKATLIETTDELQQVHIQKGLQLSS